MATKKASKNKKRNKILLIAVTAVLLVLIVVFAFVFARFVTENNYNNAIALMNDGRYTDAISAFEGLNGYKNSAEKIEECKVAFTDQMQKRIDSGDYSKFVAHTRVLSEKIFEALLSDLTFTPSQQDEFYNYFFQNNDITSITAFCNEISRNSKYLDLISEHSDVKNLLALYGIFDKAYDYNYDYIALFQDHMQEITYLWDTDVIERLMTADDIIAYYMNGTWRGVGDQSKYYLEFYHKSGTSVNLTTCSYNIPYPEITFSYWDMQNLELVFLDKRKNVLAKVYKIEFIDPNTISVYSYDSSSSYTLTRTFQN